MIDMLSAGVRRGGAVAGGGGLPEGVGSEGVVGGGGEMNGTLHGAGERGVGGGTCVGGGVCSVLAPERDVFVAVAAEDKVQVLDQGRRVRFAGRGGVAVVAPAVVPLEFGTGGADVRLDGRTGGQTILLVFVD